MSTPVGVQKVIVKSTCIFKGMLNSQWECGATEVICFYPSGLN